MDVVMLVVAMRFAGAQRYLVHLDHGHLQVQVMIDGTGLRWAARVEQTVRRNRVADDLCA